VPKSCSRHAPPAPLCSQQEIRNIPQSQREAIAKLLMQEIEKLKALLSQDPSSYDNWFAMGEMALEIALAITGEEAHAYLMEVRLSACRASVSIICHPPPPLPDTSAGPACV
jgi:hypothetical protein